MHLRHGTSLLSTPLPFFPKPLKWIKSKKETQIIISTQQASSMHLRHGTNPLSTPGHFGRVLLP